MKRWIKIYTMEWMEGSIRTDLTPAERSVWADLLVMAGVSRREGFIERSEGIPYTLEQLADRFIIPVELLRSTIEKCKAEGRIQQDGDNTMQITNWDKYQFVASGKKKELESPLERQLREARQTSKLVKRYPSAARIGLAELGPEDEQ